MDNADGGGNKMRRVQVGPDEMSERAEGEIARQEAKPAPVEEGENRKRPVPRATEPFRYMSRGFQPSVPFVGNWNRAKGFNEMTLNPNALRLGLPANALATPAVIIGALRAARAPKPVALIAAGDDTMYVARIDTEFDDRIQFADILRLPTEDAPQPLARIVRESPSSIVFQFPSGAKRVNEIPNFAEPAIMWLGEYNQDGTAAEYAVSDPSAARLASMAAKFQSHAKYAHLYCVDPLMIVEYEFELTRRPENELEKGDAVRVVENVTAENVEQFVWPFELDTSAHLDQMKYGFFPELQNEQVRTALVVTNRTYERLPAQDLDLRLARDSVHPESGYFMDDADRRRLLRVNYSDKLAPGKTSYNVTWIAAHAQIIDAHIVSMSLNWRLFTRQEPVEFYLAHLILPESPTLYCGEDALAYWFGVFGQRIVIDKQRFVNSSRYKLKLQLNSSLRTPDYLAFVANLKTIRPPRNFSVGNIEKTIFTPQ